MQSQEVSNKELQKALRHMRKAEDQYYNSKGWPFGSKLFDSRKFQLLPNSSNSSNFSNSSASDLEAELGPLFTSL